MFAALSKYHLVLEGDKDVFNSILKSLIIQSTSAIAKATYSEAFYNSPIHNRKATNLFCE